MGVAQRVQKHRDNLRKAGLRPIQIWVPDTRLEGFADKCREQSLIAGEADSIDEGLEEFMDSTIHDIEGWT